MTIQPKTLGCVKKWLMLYSLKFQRDNRKKALAVDPAKGKTGKKAVFSPHCGDETTTYYNRAKHFHVKNTLPTAGSRRSLRRHKHNVFVVFNAEVNVS